MATYGQFSCPPMGTFSCPLTIEEGTFTALPVAPVGIVFDDLIERSDREGYLTVEETRRWFAERGIE
jgi:hypothetical protein